MDPASKIIRRFGGAYAVAAITGTAYTAPYRWQAPREKGGTGGLIPQRHHATLLAYARAHGIRLSADEFLPTEPDPAPRSSAAVPAAPAARARGVRKPESSPEAEPTCSADSERAMPPASPAPLSFGTFSWELPRAFPISPSRDDPADD